METKKTTPILTVILYIIGIIFLAVSAFMLCAGVVYTKGYLASYDMSFADMWSNSTQYVIEKFVPYLAYGVISIGIGKAIKEFKNAAKPVIEIPEIEIPEIEVPEVKLPEGLDEQSANIDKTLEKVGEISQALEEFKVVTNIKLEEMEKRESFRLKEAKEIINGEFDTHMANRAAAEALILKLLGADDEEIEEVAAVAPSEEPIEELVEEPIEEPTEVIEVRHQVRRVRRFLK